MAIVPVIMCGGSGTRLWPASRPSNPKQFISLIGGDSLFEQTLDRASAIEGVERILIVTGLGQAAWVTAQIQRSQIPVTVLFEPEARDSAPAIAAAAQWIAMNCPGAVAAIFASDHHIPDTRAFAQTIQIASRAAQAGRIVTLGVEPRYPATAYGYIRPGAPLGHDGVSVLEEFVEKPDQPTAAQYIADGFVWNSGNFIANAQTLVEELEAHQPELAKTVALAVETAVPTSDGLVLGDAFRTATKISIDFAVMEKTTRAAVVRARWGWSDLGDWNSVSTVIPRDAGGNAAQGDVVLHGAENCVVRAAPGMVAAAVGVKDLAIVAEGDAVLVCPLEQSQSVKAIVGSLKDRNLPQSDAPKDRFGTRQLSLTAYRDRFVQWLRTAALPVWWALGADHTGWGYHESMSFDGAPTGAVRRARVQLRQSFVYARAGVLNWAGPWRAAVRQGLDGFVAHYARPDGLFCTKVSPDGDVVDDTPLLYDHAFVLLAWANAHKLEPDYESRALALLTAIENEFAHSAGGYRENEPEQYQSNPHMHFLEAMLAWMDVSPNPIWGEIAGRIVKLARDKFIDPTTGAIREFFDSDWAPAPGDAGRRVEPGHQFEWAWLLERWARMTNEAAAGAEVSAVAQRLFRNGCQGVDAQRGVAMDAMFDTGEVMVSRARLWPQTEWLKSALLFANAPDADPMYKAQALQACAALSRYLDVDTPGMWRDKLTEDNVFIQEAVTASSFYHIFTAVEALTAGGGVSDCDIGIGPTMAEAAE